MIQLKNENVQEKKVDVVEEPTDTSDTLSVSTPVPPPVENLPKVKVCNNLKKFSLLTSKLYILMLIFNALNAAFHNKGDLAPLDGLIPKIAE